MPALRTALANIATFDADSNEAMIRRLRAEAQQRLEAVPNGNDDLVAVCRLVFEILNLQDRINQDRHRISSLHGVEPGAYPISTSNTARQQTNSPQRMNMTKHTTIHHGVILQMALVGFEIEKDRIEAAIAEIQAELGNSRSTSRGTNEPAAPRRKCFSAAARKRMAAAQKKRWKALKAQQQAEAKKAKPTAPVKRQKATITTAKKKRTAPAKAAKKIARAVSKPKAKAVAPRPQTTPASIPDATLGTPAVPVEVTVEPTPATE